MSDLVRNAAEREPTALALDDGNGRRLSFAELDRRVDATAHHFAEAGAKVGDTIVLLTSARPDQLVWIHGAWRLGCVVAPLHPKSTAREVALAVAAIQPTLAIVDGDTRIRFDSSPQASPADEPPGTDSNIAPGTVANTVAGTGPGRDDLIIVEAKTLAAVRASDPLRIHRPDGRAAVVWTSGTAGRPRGVALSWEALLFHAEATRKRLELEPDDRWYGSLSLAHVGGLALVARAATIGSAVVLPGPFTVPDFVRLAREGRITHASLVPVMLQRILEATGDAAAPRGLRAILLGGGPAPPALVERAQKSGYPVAPTYGLSEASSQVATATPKEALARPDAVGAPLPGVDVRLSDDGEILVRGPSLAERYIGSAESLLDRDGWLHTGDLGALDAAGVLAIRGRRTERIVTGGVNVDPLEVESALRLLPQVADACVVGIENDTWGETPVALVIPAAPESWSPDASRPSETVSGGRPSPEELRTALSADLRREKLPSAFHWVASLPRNRMGKLDRAEARRIAIGLEP